jgi:hypothetical protein
MNLAEVPMPQRVQGVTKFQLKKHAKAKDVLSTVEDRSSAPEEVDHK